MSFLVDEGGIGEGRDEGSIDSEGAVTYAEEGGEEARDDENGQQDDQRGCETGRRHADETLALGTRRENDGGRVVLGLLQSERQITRRHHLYSLLIIINCYKDQFTISALNKLIFLTFTTTDTAVNE